MRQVHVRTHALFETFTMVIFGLHCDGIEELIFKLELYNVHDIGTWMEPLVLAF